VARPGCSSIDHLLQDVALQVIDGGRGGEMSSVDNSNDTVAWLYLAVKSALPPMQPMHAEQGKGRHYSCTWLSF
jgi:hypothetical protein